MVDYSEDNFKWREEEPEYMPEDYEPSNEELEFSANGELIDETDYEPGDEPPDKNDPFEEEP